MDRTVVERFWQRVDVGGPRQCWRWNRGVLGTAKGRQYGRFWDGRRNTTAHRFSYELFKGPIPPGLSVCHTCDNPRCVNPAHLWLGSSAENTADRDAKQRQVRGAKAAKSKLTARQVRAFRARRKRGESLTALAAEAGCHPDSLRLAITGRTWKHLGLENFDAPQRDKRGEHNPKAKLTESSVREIRKMRANGATLRECGERFGVSLYLIHDVVKRRSWKHVV